MTIAIFIGYMGSGGAEIVAIKSANVLARMTGNKVYFLFIPNANSFYLDEIDESVHVLPLKSSSLLRSMRELRGVFHDYNIDMVISHMTDENIITSLSILGLDIRHVGYEHNHTEEMRQRGILRWLVTKKLMYLSYPRMEKLIVVSHGLKSIFSAFIAKHKIIPIYNPCATEAYSKRARWSMIQRKLNIAFVGRNVYQKNFAYAKNLFKEIQTAFPDLDLKLNVYGTGYENEASTDYIEYHGHKDRKGIYANNDMLLMSSRYEGFGNVVIEAVQGGCFPVVKKVDYGPTEIVEQTFGCIFFEVKDVISLLKRGWDEQSISMVMFNEENFENEFKKVIG